MTNQRGRKKGSGKTKIAIDRHFLSSKEPEEILFKLNELLFGDEAAVLRKNPRIAVNLSLIWSFGKEIRQGNTYTLSREGMFIKTPSPAEIDSEIEISFIIPGHPNLIRSLAKVVHKIEPEEANQQGLVSGMAVIFKEMDLELKDKLDQFINKRLKKGSKPPVWI